MASYIIQDTTLTAIADSIRAKTGTTDPIKVSAMADAITSIEAGSGGGGTKYHITYAGDLPPDFEEMIIDAEIHEGGYAVFAFTSNYITTLDVACGDGEYSNVVCEFGAKMGRILLLYNPTQDITVTIGYIE